MAKNTKIEESHVIPSLVFKRAKKRAITGMLRNPLEPNKIIQDGEKLYLLCGDCEDLFNIYETEFSKYVFHKCKNGSLQNLNTMIGYKGLYYLCIGEFYI